MLKLKKSNYNKIGFIKRMKIKNKINNFIISQGEIRKMKRIKKIRKGKMNNYICSPIKREKFYRK
jgi:hypothetical protein